MPLPFRPWSARIAAAVLGILLALAMLTPARGQDQAGGAVLDHFEVGFYGEAQVGYWTPVRVELSGKTDGVRVEVQVPDGDGLPMIYRDKRADESSAAVRFLYVKIGRRRGSITVRLVHENSQFDSESSQLLERDLTIHPSTRESILCIQSGDDRIALEDIVRRSTAPENESPFAYYVDDASVLPDEWIGYSSIDQILLTTSDTGLLESMSDAQRNALEMWVRMGGRLLFCVGSNATDVAQLSSLKELLPGAPTEVVTQRRAVGMEEFVVQSSEPLAAYKITLFDQVQGRILASEQSLTGQQRPVICRRSHGMGHITTVATDLESAPFSNWESRSEILLKLLRITNTESGESRQGSTIGRVTHIGYEDMAGQLRSMLDRFANEDGRSVMVAFSPVAACLALYILLIAPGDYFLLKKLIGRMELTWLTFPLIVVLACGSILWAASQLRRAETSVNQLEIVDFDHATSTMRGHNWSSIYSPQTTSHDLELDSQVELSLQEGGGGAEQQGRLMSWMGLPGAGLGGMNTSTAPGFDDPYTVEFNEQRTAVIRDMPIAIASTKQMSGLWWRTRVDGGEVNLVRKREYIQGEFANPFPVEIRDGVLFYNDWVYALQRRVLPQQTISIAEMEEPRDLVWRLTRRRVVDSKSTASYENTPWDPTSESPNRMVEMLTLYSLAGGQAYTQLSHRYLDHLDLSEHLDNGRAIFVGRVEAPLTEVGEEGKPLDPNAIRFTYCRAVFPVREPAGD